MHITCAWASALFCPFPFQRQNQRGRLSLCEIRKQSVLKVAHANHDFRQGRDLWPILCPVFALGTALATGGGMRNENADGWERNGPGL